MAASDWTYFYYYDNSQAPILYTPEGVTPPIPSAGNYGRQLTSGYYGGHVAGFRLTNPSFVNLPNTKAVRMQGYFRLTSNSGNFFGMTVKGTNDYGGGGYSLGFRGGGPKIIFLDNAGNATDLGDSFGSVLQNTWYGLRIEVYPIGSAADRIICYKESSPGSNSWIKIHDVTILSSNPAYVPWSSGRTMTFKSLESCNGIVDLISVTLGNATPP
jgi:hypothetical protein